VTLLGRATLACLAMIRGESGQAGLEYLLAMGAVSVVVAGGLIAGFEALTRGVLPAICDAVDPLRTGGTSCIGF
jgi:hypothetical protein